MEKVLLPWGIDYCKCGAIKTSHTPLCVDCIRDYRRRQKINRIVDITKEKLKI